jgi:predicted nucleotidyltransferase
MNEDAKLFLKEFEDQFPKRKVIFLFKAGSHFFDLNTENSDNDYRGIYMPSSEDFYYGETKRSMYERKTQPNKIGTKNSKNDTDFTLFSVTKFLKLLGAGDFNCMEMLHTPENKILIDSEYMKYLRSIKSSILVNDISAFLGFIKKEYKRFGVNIYHYQDQQDFIDFLNSYPLEFRLQEIWKEIQQYAKSNNRISFGDSDTGNHTLIPSIKIAQRMFPYSVTVKYITESLNDNLTRYGHRQKFMAESNHEFKGLFHALRLIYEANDLYDFGEFKIPFNKERHEMLFNIKTGNIEQTQLFDLIDKEIDKLYIREKFQKSNKKVVLSIIEKLIFCLEGSGRIQYLLGDKYESN